MILMRAIEALIDQDCELTGELITKITIEREPSKEAKRYGVLTLDPIVITDRKRGRPPGSKNKPKKILA